MSVFVSIIRFKVSWFEGRHAWCPLSKMTSMTTVCWRNALRTYTPISTLLKALFAWWYLLIWSMYSRVSIVYTMNSTSSVIHNGIARPFIHISLSLLKSEYKVTLWNQLLTDFTEKAHLRNVVRCEECGCKTHIKISLHCFVLYYCPAPNHTNSTPTICYVGLSIAKTIRDLDIVDDHSSLSYTICAMLLKANSTISKTWIQWNINVTE